MRTVTRYYLFQIPGWVLAAVLVTVLHAWLGLPVWAALTVLGVVVMKDVICYPFLRKAYQLEASGAAQLVGQRGVARDSLDPTGYVYVHGELWRARTERDSLHSAWVEEILYGDGGGGIRRRQWPRCRESAA